MGYHLPQFRVTDNVYKFKTYDEQKALITLLNAYLKTKYAESYKEKPHPTITNGIIIIVERYNGCCETGELEVIKMSKLL